MIKHEKGVTLIELIIALAVIGILLPPLLKILLSFTKSNQSSRQYLTTGILTSNLYEQAKGMTISELSEWVSMGTVVQNDMLFRIDGQRYDADEDHNSLDIIITQDAYQDFLCYIIGDTLEDINELAGNGKATLNIQSNDNHVLISVSDENHRSVTHSIPITKSRLLINLNAQSMGNGQSVELSMKNHSILTWECTVQEKPIHTGNISIFTENQQINTRDIWNTIQDMEVLINSRKTSVLEGIPIYLEVYAFRRESGDQWESTPFSIRQGILNIK